MQKYTTFLRSARNWEEFASAKIIVQETGLSRGEAYEKCQDFNKNRTVEQIDAGTKMEFTTDFN